MRVTYKGTEFAWVPLIGLTVQPGETVEVADEAGESLIQQPAWAKAKPAVKERDS